MAQAARLNLRMQKELKLLLTDPPPFVSLPMLSSDSTDLSSSSLSSIDAKIEGPEGTVYAGGIFNIKIQIPDRYPFQPPNVTFGTPIYHPNIDNGGRICLDILNLPPKGAWQPSLNISTVLTSIGLLLSEPNPDDGLMCEASREYKYNRQIFDQKARSMTERYAKAGTSGESTGDGSIPANVNPSMETDVPELDLVPKNLDKEYATSHRKLCGVSSKLSLESSSPSQRRHLGGKENEMETNSLLLNSKIFAMAPSKSLPPLVGNHVEQHTHQDHGRKVDNDRANVSCKKLCSVGKKPLLESLCSPHKRNVDDKVNEVLPRKLSLSQTQNVSVVSSKLSLMPKDGNHDEEKQPCKLDNENAENGMDEQHEAEVVIVLDSEDSEEEVKEPTRSRLSLARKRLIGKWKAKPGT